MRLSLKVAPSPQLWQTFVVLGTLLLGAYLLRIADLNTYGFWQDEAAQVDAARAASPWQVIQTVSHRGSGAVPLDHLLTWMILRLVGDTEMVLRYLPLMWSMITVALTYRLGEALSPGAGKWAALAIAISPLAVAYAREARFYALALMWGTALLTVAAHLARGWLHPSLKIWLSSFGLALATIYTHVYSAFLWVVGLGIVWAMAQAEQRVRLAGWFLSALMLAGILFLPWLAFGLNTHPHPFGTDTLGVRQINALLLGLELPPVLPRLRADWLAQAYPFIALVFSGLGIYALIRRREHRLLGFSLVSLYLLGAVAVTASNLAARYFFVPRQFLFLAPLRALLIGMGMQSVERCLSDRALPLAGRAGVLGLAMILFVAPAVRVIDLDLYAPSASVAREAVAFLSAQSLPQSKDVWVSGAVGFALDFYAHRHGVQLQWRYDFTRDALAQAPPGTMALVEQRAQMVTHVALLEALGFERIWPPEGRFERYDLVIYQKR